MTFWLIIGAMTAAAVLAVLVPLFRPRMVMRARESSRDAGNQVGLLAATVPPFYLIRAADGSITPPNEPSNLKKVTGTQRHEGVWDRVS